MTYPNRLTTLSTCLGLPLPWLSSITRALEACAWGEGAELQTPWWGQWCSDELVRSNVGRWVCEDPNPVRSWKAGGDGGFCSSPSIFY